MIWRILALLVGLLVLFDVGQGMWRAPGGRRTPPPAVQPASRPEAPSRAGLPRVPPASPPAKSSPCAPAPRFADAAARNAASLAQAPWSVFGRGETGWEIYAPLTAHEIATVCAPDTAGFAEALARWQGGQGLPPSGIMDEASLDRLRLVWLRRRPFLADSAHGCPPPPAPEQLAPARPDEGYRRKPVELRADVLAAYRALAAAARAASPAVAADPELLTIFSGYRDPATERARCADGGCGSVARASCSAHRTGTAMDLYLGAAPGFPPESSADANRLHQSRTPAYRWLVSNAGRFGFVNYPFEPWHWEWAGRAVDASPTPPPAR